MEFIVMYSIYSELASFTITTIGSLVFYGCISFLEYREPFCRNGQNKYLVRTS